MGPGSFEPNFIVKNRVDQNPIRLDMAVPVDSPIPAELIAIFRRKWFLGEEEVDNRFEFCEGKNGAEETWIGLTRAMKVLFFGSGGLTAASQLQFFLNFHCT